MDTTFTIRAPHEEALALIKGKPAVTSDVFYGMLPELRARAFTVSGVQAAGVLQRCRDAVAGVVEGEHWEDAKDSLIQELDPYLGDGAPIRAELVLRTNAFQAFSASNWRVAQADDDTTHLQYIHGDQAKVPTPEHEALDGIVLPKDDPFWQDHYGPWGHIGCVCFARPMNEDMVEQQRDEDAKKNPEDKNVIEGAVVDQLHQGTIIRGTQRHDVSAPEGEGAFKFDPDSLGMGVDEIEGRYDAETWGEFVKWARNTHVTPDLTVWQWMTESDGAD